MGQFGEDMSPCLCRNANRSTLSPIAFNSHRFVDSSFWFYPLLFCVGGIAGAVDAMAGGGGIITLPVLLSVGLPVPVALGTNKLQASFGSVSAAWHYARAKLVDLRTCGVGIAATFVGALLGAWCVQRLSSAILQATIPWVLAGIVVYTIFRPRAGETDHPPRIPLRLFFSVFGIGLGFYDGFIGPGTGPFWTIAIVTLLGFNFLRATATAKVMNATSNVTALLLFVAGGHVEYRAGFAMGAGQLIGSRLGARLVVARGAKFVRPVFLTMVVVVMARLLWVEFAAR